MSCIRKAEPEDLPEVVRLAAELWPQHTLEELEEELEPYTDRRDAAVFLAYQEGRKPCGFAQCGLRRDYVEGTEPSPVGYLEGIYVRPLCRGQGTARLLVETCQQWAIQAGCREFASDCELTNEESRKFHLAVGFEEANRIICFIKKLR